MQSASFSIADGTGWVRAPVQSAMKQEAAIAMMLCVALASGCAAAEPSSVGGPADPMAEMRPDLIVAEPTTVAPGEMVSLTFPEETLRGILFVLEQRVGDTWVHRFNLSSDGPGPEFEMGWFPLDAEGIGFPDIGVGGPGPDRVPIPDVADPGDYRICTGNAGDEFCTPIKISAP